MYPSIIGLSFSHIQILVKINVALKDNIKIWQKKHALHQV